eukprot:CAMPEP_0113937696 /NCGR_PEP_ID=MMETSP1339-20121228/4261_1 /TAXON_ID=94617 /ORGANISM="Fibrocapsa japonica" /LENGTH=65 /DNA_ID=CAMNT_0000940559 /DNA_START=79 /DNA_END=276 /DNA_ORIENTATION=- /assembly_acc=CAM_ASM_000762
MPHAVPEEWARMDQTQYKKLACLLDSTDSGEIDVQHIIWAVKHPHDTFQLLRGDLTRQSTSIDDA